MKRFILFITVSCLLLWGCMGVAAGLMDVRQAKAEDGVLYKTTKTCYWKGNLQVTSEYGNYSPRFVETASHELKYDDTNNNQLTSSLQDWSQSTKKLAFFAIAKDKFQNMAKPTLYIKGQGLGGYLKCCNSEFRTDDTLPAFQTLGMSSDGIFTQTLDQYKSTASVAYIVVCIYYDSDKESSSEPFSIVLYDADEYTDTYQGLISVQVQAASMTVQQGASVTLPVDVSGSDYAGISTGVSGTIGGVTASYENFVENGGILPRLSVKISASATAGTGTVMLPVNICGLGLSIPVTVIQGTGTPGTSPGGTLASGAPGVSGAPGGVTGTELGEPIVQIKKHSKKVKITWEAVAGSQGYEIYRSHKKKKAYKLVATVGADVQAYVDKNVKKGKVYFYKIQAYTEINGEKITSPFSKPGKASFLLKAPRLKVKKSGSYIYVRWYGLGKAKGLFLYYKKAGGSFNSREFKGKSLKGVGVRIPISSRNSVFNSKKGKYFFKARTYQKSGKKRIYSAYSKVVKTK